MFQQLLASRLELIQPKLTLESPSARIVGCDYGGHARLFRLGLPCCTLDGLLKDAYYEYEHVPYPPLFKQMRRTEVQTQLELFFERDYPGAHNTVRVVKTLFLPILLVSSRRYGRVANSCSFFLQGLIYALGCGAKDDAMQDASGLELFKHFLYELAVYPKNYPSSPWNGLDQDWLRGELEPLRQGMRAMRDVILDMISQNPQATYKMTTQLEALSTIGESWARQWQASRECKPLPRIRKKIGTIALLSAMVVLIGIALIVLARFRGFSASWQHRLASQDHAIEEMQPWKSSSNNALQALAVFVSILLGAGCICARRYPSTSQRTPAIASVH